MKGALLAVITMLAMPAAAETITARQVIERIQKQVGVPWREQTVDTFKAGDPDARVTGIATTMMATMDVLARAVASGKNLIITHEPTFYDHLDKGVNASADDAVLAAKKAFIAEHGLVVWRFHDHWHRRHPDGINQGMARALGWSGFQLPGEPTRFTIPATDLGTLVTTIKEKLGARAMRVVGDPRMKLSKVALVAGAAGSRAQIAVLGRDDVEVELIGETQEWEAVEYARDAVAQGRRKALIIVGHVPSEQAGMEECARWLKTFVTEVPIEYIPAAEAYWAPK